MIFLNIHLLVFFFSEAVLLFLLAIAFVMALGIVSRWDFTKTTQLQYTLEKRAYLVVLLISFVLLFKLFLFPYFTYVLDSLSSVVPGAMCGAGVLGANGYGMATFVLKLFSLFVIGIWLIVNREDIKALNYPYFSKKMWLFFVVFALAIAETVVEFLYFANISTTKVLQCCSTIYGADAQNGLLFGLDDMQIVVLYYLLYLLGLVTLVYGYAFLSLAVHLLFLVVGYYAVVYFFGLYIYELPTHHCPFCMLQSDYYYAGYFVWISLFLGVFFSGVNAVLKLLIGYGERRYFRYGIFFDTFFVLLCSFFVIRYYIVNGVML